MGKSASRKCHFDLSETHNGFSLAMEWTETTVLRFQLPLSQATRSCLWVQPGGIIQFQHATLRLEVELWVNHARVLSLSLRFQGYMALGQALVPVAFLALHAIENSSWS